MTRRPSKSPAEPAPALVLRECAICQSSIYPTEDTTACPSCGLTFHSECWEANLGCAAYGCDKVNAMAPAEDTAAAPLVPVEEVIEEPPEPLPWKYILLGASTLAMLLSAFTFGLPSLAIGSLAGHRMSKQKNWRDPVLITVAVLSLIGLIAGLVISRLWWTGEYTGSNHG